MSWQLLLSCFFILLPAIYLITCVCYLVMHRYFIIFPSRNLSKLPSDFHIQYEELFFTTVDNVLLCGWLIKGNPGAYWKDFTILLFPGNKGAMSDFLLQVKHLAEAGFTVFLFGYRGFGKSQKKWPVEKGVYADSEAACEYLIKEKDIPAEKIIFLGQSLGCAMASRTAIKFNPYALILEGGFPSIAKVASRAIRWLPLNLITISRFDTEAFLKKVKCPVLILHSKEDYAIPLSDADVLFNAVAGKREKCVISGPHAKGLEYDHEKYLKELDRFLR